MTQQIAKIPTMDELLVETGDTIKQNQLMVLLNQSPPANWLKPHPTAKAKNEKGESVSSQYLPIDKVEYMLNRIFGGFWVEVIDSKVMANSVSVTVRVHVKNPLTGDEMWNDGVGASPIQTDSGKGAMDWNFAKSAGVMMAFPSAKSYAVKDAAEGFGKIFGRDLNRTMVMDYSSLLKNKIELEDIQDLFIAKEHLISAEDKIHIERIIKNKEENSYRKVYNDLNKLKEPA